MPVIELSAATARHQVRETRPGEGAGAGPSLRGRDRPAQASLDVTRAFAGYRFTENRMHVLDRTADQAVAHGRALPISARRPPIFRPEVRLMELLEREEALGGARRCVRVGCARRGGRVVFVTGEPGIGKTALVTRFRATSARDARVLLGTCDDLSIPRPLGAASRPRRQRLARSSTRRSPPARLRTTFSPLLVAELELAPAPTVLILEDVHWADDATLDAITILGRRIGSLPAVLVLTVRARRGAAGPSAPRGARRGPAADSVFVELAPLSEAAVAVARRRSRRASVYGATGGNPFYVTRAAHVPRRRRAAALGGERGARPRVAARPAAQAPGRARLGRPAPHLHRDPRRRDARLGRGGRGARAPAAAGGRPAARAASATSSPGTRSRSSIPVAGRRRLHGEILDVLLATDADPADIVHHAEAAGAEDVVADVRARRRPSRRGARLEPRGVLALPPRARLRRPAAAAEQAELLEELATAAYYVGRIAEALRRDRAGDRDLARAWTTGPRSAVAHASLSRLHWFLGDGAPAREQAARGGRDPRAARRLGRARPRLQRRRPARDARARRAAGARLGGARRSSSPPGSAPTDTRVHALVNIASAQLQLDPDATRAAARGARRRPRDRRPARGRRARSSTSATR